MRHAPESSGIYLVACYPYIKVGYSGNIARRMRELRGRRGCRFPVDLSPAEPLALIRYWAGGWQFEKLIHDALADHRVIGEWYQTNPWMVRWVNRQSINTFTPGAIKAMSAGQSPQTWWRYPDGTPTPAMLATHPDARAAKPDTEETQP